MVSGRVSEYVLPEHSRARPRTPTKLGEGAEPWSWLASRTHGDAVVPRPRAFRASGRRPRLFSRCLTASESHARGARAIDVAAEPPLGRRTHGCGRGAVGEPSVSAGFCNRRHRMNAIRGVGACVISVRCELRLEHLHNRSLRLSKPCKSALQWSQKPDTFIRARRMPFQAEQMPLVYRGALGRPRPPCC